MLQTTEVSSTVLTFRLVNGCDFQFENDYPIALRGLMDQHEFETMMNEFSRVYREAMPSIGSFVVSSVFCICTCGICMFRGVSKMVSAHKVLQAAVKTKSDALVPRGIQLRLRQTQHHHHQVTSSHGTTVHHHSEGGLVIEMHIPRVITQTIVPLQAAGIPVTPVPEMPPQVQMQMQPQIQLQIQPQMQVQMQPQVQMQMQPQMQLQMQPEMQSQGSIQFQLQAPGAGDAGPSVTMTMGGTPSAGERVAL